MEPGGMNQCVHLGLVGDIFGNIDKAEIVSLEDLLGALNIVDYVRFICGYHIHGQRATEYGGDFCALDWYAQDQSMRAVSPNVWEHYLILDQVSWG